MVVKKEIQGENMKAISKKIYKTLLGSMLLTFGILNFELSGIESRNFAIIVSFSIVLGGVFIFYGLFIDKTTTANEKDKELYEHQKFDDERLEKLYNKGEKPMAKTKKETPKENSSVDLMKRENKLLAEITKEEKATEAKRKELKSLQETLVQKGWVQKDGSWGIE
jgi:hypothetical protein